MAEPIDEFVSVDLLSNHIRQTVMPWVMYWRGRRYRLTHVGLHHTLREGRTLIHVFSVTDGVSSFRLRLDTETLHWKLVEIEDGV